MDTQPSRLTISEMSKRYNVSLRTLRFYEQKQLVRPTREGTVRFYSERDCIRVEFVLKARKLGFTLARIYRLIAERTSQKESIGDCLDVPAIDARIHALEEDRHRIASALAELRTLRDLKAAAYPTISRWLEETAA